MQSVQAAEGASRDRLWQRLGRPGAGAEEALDIAHEAVDAGDGALLGECLRRLDPCDASTREVRERALDAGIDDSSCPETAASLADDPNEVVAQVFQQSLHPGRLARRLFRHGWKGPLFLLVSACCSALPAPFDHILLGALVSALLVLLIAEARIASERIWQRQDGDLDGMPLSGGGNDPHFLIAAIGGAGGIALPIIMGFAAGMSWSFLLSLPLATSGILMLSSPRLHRIHPEFPFTCAPTMREVSAYLIAGLLACAGAVASGFLAYTGLLWHLPAIILADITWGFALRGSGLLARRIHFRLGAEKARGLPVVRRQETTCASLPLSGAPAIESVREPTVPVER